MSSVMIDLETLSVKPNAVILTVGALKFDPCSDTINDDDSLYLRIDVDEQVNIGRAIDEETIEWWGKQDPIVRDETLSDGNRVSLEYLTTRLNQFLVGAKDIWCQGPMFDMVILENLYRQIGKPAPWSYWQIRDSRTIFGVHGDPREKRRPGHHNALSDCIYQAKGIQEIYEKFQIQREV